jgi:tellurite resistance protein
VLVSPGFAFRDLLFWVALLLLAMVVLVLLRRAFGAAASTQRALAERDAVDRLQITPADHAAWVSALQRRDPGFEIADFLARVRTLFLVTQQAWSKGDLLPVRRFLSDATWLRFRVQLGLLRAQGVRNLTADVAVAGLELVGLEQNAWFDTLHVLVRARARDVDVPVDRPEAEALAAATHATAESFTEVWSLVRKPGVQTAGGSALAERACPSCGAPFDGGSASTCQYCKAVVNSGAYDWVLAEITQTVEVTRADAPVPGLESLRQADPGLSLEVLEDRASLIFWRWIEAQSTGQPERLARLAQANPMERLRADVVRLSQQHARRVFLECAVGEVRVRAFEQAPDGRMLAHVEIRWSARTGVGPVDQAPPQLPVLPQRSVFTLGRAGDAVSKVDRGMSTDRCPECGGPLGDALEPTCQWCGTVLAGDIRDWTLAEVCAVETWEGRAASPAARVAATREPSAGFPDVEERERLLYTMAAMAMADGEVDARERRLLNECAERWGLPAEQVDAALSAGPASLDVLLPDTHAGEPLLRALAQLARVDGRVDASERRMLESVAARLGLTQRLPAVLTGIGAR